eukprot:TRINITY_DN17840_c6_g1_i1.p1 TRINITY_DN17840_c6_g1~~TRINITY_DN17840_c6_g1_i1.p1  ORF type:complete len:659 (+),score=113.34 TRINITY_DN17840_c6_g1_i1:274-1977(+)
MVDVSSASVRETQDAVKEGKLLAAFKHPYVVRYRENFIESGWFCILMDYCEGGDLGRQIELAKKKRQPFAEDQVLRWMTQALLALKYIHDKHVLHRDLKSNNFFLSKSNNLKMGDFGIAKVLSCTAACARTQIGTPYYLSPEVCLEKPYTWPSDIWAMGCIFYELCERKVPFDASNISGLVHKITKGPTPQISSGYSDFSRQLCCEMLNRSSDARPSAESILRRPRIQEVVRLMLEEAQAAHSQEDRQTPSATSEGVRSGAAGGDMSVALSPLPPGCGPYAENAGLYRRGCLVEYYSNTHKDWLPATVTNVDSDGRIIIDLKPNTWVTREQQAVQVRPRRREVVAAPPQIPAPMAAPNGGVGGLACGTPMRQRSPSSRAMTPGRGRGFNGGAGSRAGSRSGTPNGCGDVLAARRRVSREACPSGVGAATPGIGAGVAASAGFASPAVIGGGGGGGGFGGGHVGVGLGGCGFGGGGVGGIGLQVAASRAGTPGRAGSPGPSPVGGYGDRCDRGVGGMNPRRLPPEGGLPPLSGLPPINVRPPGMPRVSGSPLRPCRAAGAAGMAIAGV